MKDDTELADEKLSRKLHIHNPPVDIEHDFEPGDLVMVKITKQKSSLETYF